MNVDDNIDIVINDDINSVSGDYTDVDESSLRSPPPLSLPSSPRSPPPPSSPPPPLPPLPPPSSPPPPLPNANNVNTAQQYLQEINVFIEKIMKDVNEVKKALNDAKKAETDIKNAETNADLNIARDSLVSAVSNVNYAYENAKIELHEAYNVFGNIKSITEPGPVTIKKADLDVLKKIMNDATIKIESANKSVNDILSKKKEVEKLLLKIKPIKAIKAIFNSVKNTITSKPKLYCYDYFNSIKKTEYPYIPPNNKQIITNFEYDNKFLNIENDKLYAYFLQNVNVYSLADNHYNLIKYLNSLVDLNILDEKIKNNNIITIKNINRNLESSPYINYIKKMNAIPSFIIKKNIFEIKNYLDNFLIENSNVYILSEKNIKYLCYYYELVIEYYIFNTFVKFVINTNNNIYINTQIYKFSKIKINNNKYEIELNSNNDYTKNIIDIINEIEEYFNSNNITPNNIIDNYINYINDIYENNKSLFDEFKKFDKIKKKYIDALETKNIENEKTSDIADKDYNNNLIENIKKTFNLKENLDNYLLYLKSIDDILITIFIKNKIPYKKLAIYGGGDINNYKKRLIEILNKIREEKKEKLKLYKYNSWKIPDFIKKIPDFIKEPSTETKIVRDKIENIETEDIENKRKIRNNIEIDKIKNELTLLSKTKENEKYNTQIIVLAKKLKELVENTIDYDSIIANIPNLKERIEGIEANITIKTAETKNKLNIKIEELKKKELEKETEIADVLNANSETIKDYETQIKTSNEKYDNEIKIKQDAINAATSLSAKKDLETEIFKLKREKQYAENKIKKNIEQYKDPKRIKELEKDLKDIKYKSSKEINNSLDDLKKLNKEEYETYNKTIEDQPDVNNIINTVDFDRYIDIFNNILFMILIISILFVLLIFTISIINLILIVSYIILDIIYLIFNNNHIYNSSFEYSLMDCIYCTKDDYSKEKLYIFLEQYFTLKTLNIVFYAFIIVLFIIALYLILYLYSEMYNKKFKGSLNKIEQSFLVIFTYILIFVIIHIGLYQIIFQNFIIKYYNKANTNEKTIDNIILSNIIIDDDFYNIITKNNYSDINDFISNKISSDINSLSKYLLIYNIYTYISTYISNTEDNINNLKNYLTSKDNNISFYSLLNMQNTSVMQKYYENLDFYQNIADNNDDTNKEINTQIQNLNNNINDINKYIINKNSTSVPMYYIFLYCLLIVIISALFVYMILTSIIKSSNYFPESVKYLINKLMNIITTIFNYINNIYNY